MSSGSRIVQVLSSSHYCRICSSKQMRRKRKKQKVRRCLHLEARIVLLHKLWGSRWEQLIQVHVNLTKGRRTYIRRKVPCNLKRPKTKFRLLMHLNSKMFLRQSPLKLLNNLVLIGVKESSKTTAKARKQSQCKNPLSLNCKLTTTTPTRKLANMRNGVQRRKRK